MLNESNSVSVNSADDEEAARILVAEEMARHERVRAELERALTEETAGHRKQLALITEMRKQIQDTYSGQENSPSPTTSRKKAVAIIMEHCLENYARSQLILAKKIRPELDLTRSDVLKNLAGSTIEPSLLSAQIDATGLLHPRHFEVPLSFLNGVHLREIKKSFSENPDALRKFVKLEEGGLRPQLFGVHRKPGKTLRAPNRDMPPSDRMHVLLADRIEEYLVVSATVPTLHSFSYDDAEEWAREMGVKLWDLPFLRERQRGPVQVQWPQVGEFGLDFPTKEESFNGDGDFSNQRCPIWLQRDEQMKRWGYSLAFGRETSHHVPLTPQTFQMGEEMQYREVIGDVRVHASKTDDPNAQMHYRCLGYFTLPLIRAQSNNEA